jgi:thiamine-monophosphate kinase
MSDGRTVRELGEFGLIEALHGALPTAVVAGPGLRLGIGDDAAVFDPSPGASLVVTSDSLIEGVHFRLGDGWSDWRSLGHKTLAVNLSDLAAMGAVPKLTTVTLGLRGTERVEDLLDLYRGLGELAARHGTFVAGGDLVASPTALGLHVTAIGEAPGGKVLTRSGARPGDLIAVSGTLGAAAAGLRLLLAGPDDPRRGAATAGALVAALLRPEPRLDLAPILVGGGATSAMDLSDGLFGDLQKILAASGVAARLDAAQIPVAAAVRALFPNEWLDLATRGGEDYELLITAPPDAFAAIAREAATIGATVTAIGEVEQVREGKPSLTLRGLDAVDRPIFSGAFDHFAAREGDELSSIDDGGPYERPISAVCDPVANAVNTASAGTTPPTSNRARRRSVRA